SSVGGVGRAGAVAPEGRRSGRLGHRQERFARECRGRIKRAAATIGKQKGAVTAAAILCDPVGIGEREQSAGGLVIVIFFAADRLGPSLRHCARILGSTGTIATELVKPMSEIDIIATKTPFGQNSGDVGSEHAG